MKGEASIAAKMHQVHTLLTIIHQPDLRDRSEGALKRFKKWFFDGGFRAPSTYHQRIFMNLSFEILRLLKEKKGDCEIFAAPFDIRLPGDKQTDEETLNVVQPDLSIICERSKPDKRGCKGAPNLIIEIVSPGTAKKDLKFKFHPTRNTAYRNTGLFTQMSTRYKSSN